MPKPSRRLVSVCGSPALQAFFVFVLGSTPDVPRGFERPTPRRLLSSGQLILGRYSFQAIDDQHPERQSFRRHFQA